MDKLALVLAVAAVALAGWTAFGAGHSAGTDVERLDSLDASVSELTASIASLEKRIGEIPSAAMVGNGGMTGDDAGLEGNVRPATMSDRVAELEKTVKDQNERLASMQDQVDKQPGAGRFISPRHSIFFRSVDDAAKQLELDPGQRAQMDRIIESTKRELEDLYNTPNDEGKTWAEMKKFNLKKLTSGDASDGIVAFTSNFAKIAKFKKTKIPGSNETFGEAETRIKNLAKENIGETLNQEQKEKWDNAHTDHLVGGGGSSMTFSSVVMEREAEDK